MSASVPRRTKAYAHLQIFNTVSILLWLCVLCRTLLLLPLVGRKFLPGGIADFFIYVTTFTAAIQTLNTLFSLSNPHNRLLSVGVQLYKAWFVWLVFHVKTVKHGLFTLLVLLWAVSNIVRFGYYLYRLSRGPRPAVWITTLYANEFAFTLPLTAVAEWGLIWMRLRYSEGSFRTCLQVVLVLYIPSAYVLFGHFAQRRARLGLKQHYA